jgi:hypothetical protein
MLQVIGYLRHYRRWDGSPGHSLARQRAWVRAVAAERGDYHLRRGLVEQADGAAHGWPVLREAIRRAIDGAGDEVLVVIPTLDGIQFDLSFLELLLDESRIDAPPPICVRSGWWRPRKLGVGTNYQRRAKRQSWLLSLDDEATAFAEVVAAIRRRQRTLSRSIRKGLGQAAARGRKLGAHRRGAYRLARADRRKGGAATARLRRAKANDSYRLWVPRICAWRAAGDSLAEIAQKLADEGARTPDHRAIGPMLVHRILQRVAWSEDLGQQVGAAQTRLPGHRSG